jgi:hemin uptake protein HemP
MDAAAMTDKAPRRPLPDGEERRMDGDFRQLDDHGAQRSLARMSTPAVFGDVPAYDVRGLMRDGQQAHLVLDGQTYCLRITRSGKLILTK